ncbi:MAG TPA: hypothetical protein VEJ63_21180 [Planctomycetota bacterium]|nr:hypothetical protein [Planctomycetota bacterium]
MRTFFSIVLVLGAAALRAADAPPAAEKPAGVATLDEDGKKKAAGLIKDLGADAFDTRNNAEKELVALMPGATAQVKDALTTSKDPEVKSRLEKVLKTSALDHVDDPELLAKYAKEEATAKRFESAAKFYEKAAKLYAAKAAKEENADAKKDLSAKAELAAGRQKRANLLSKGGGAKRVQIAGGGGDGAGMVVISTIEVSDNSGGKVDLNSEDW